jgi:DNA polymerase III subunit delta'
MQFAAVQGYTSIKRRLIHIVQTHQVPHAQLFWGPEGNASLPLALAFITYLYCHNRLKNDACGQCASCRKVQKLAHPDVKFVFPTSATKQITGKDVVSTNFLTTWRSFLHKYPYGHASDWSYYLNSENKQLSIAKEEARGIIQAISLKAFEGAYKVVLIWLPEYLHISAANALLKVIEEPPPHTLFLLVSVHPDRVLGTIRSRTQQIHIPAFTDKALSGMLAQQHTLPQEQLAAITLLADGNLNKALKLVEDITGGYFDYFKNWMRLCYIHDMTQLVAQATYFQEMSKEGQRNFLSYSLHMLREALVLYFAQTGLTRATDAEQSFTCKLRQTLTHQQIKTWITWLNQAHDCIERHVNPKILYLDLSLRIARTFRPQP